MTDDTRANEEVEAQSQPEPVPSSEQTTQEVVEETATTDEPTLPEGVSERTAREFEKLRTQLAEEKARNKKPESPFDTTRQNFTPQTQNVNPLWDPNTGYVDV
jgi:hypothetical protein